MSCINKNHPDVAKLAEELNTLPAVAAAKKFAVEIVRKLKKDKVDAVVLTST